jgi:hypothetical protein
MRCINELITCLANKEDGCSGCYWESRYKSQALLHEKTLAICIAYVDLNPPRAGLAETLEKSDYTSIKEPTHHFKQSLCSSEEHYVRIGLLPFVGQPRQG